MEEGKVWTVEPLRCCVEGCASAPRLRAESPGEADKFICNRHLNVLLHGPDTGAVKFLPRSSANLPRSSQAA